MTYQYWRNLCLYRSLLLLLSATGQLHCYSRLATLLLSVSVNSSISWCRCCYRSMTPPHCCFSILPLPLPSLSPPLILLLSSSAFSLYHLDFHFISFVRLVQIKRVKWNPFRPFDKTSRDRLVLRAEPGGSYVKHYPFKINQAYVGPKRTLIIGSLLRFTRKGKGALPNFTIFNICYVYYVFLKHFTEIPNQLKFFILLVKLGCSPKWISQHWSEVKGSKLLEVMLLPHIYLLGFEFERFLVWRGCWYKLLCQSLIG